MIIIFEKFKRWWAKIFSKQDISQKLNIVDLRNSDELSSLKNWVDLYNNNPNYLDTDKCKENAITDTLNLGYNISNKMKDLILLEFHSEINNDDELNTIYQGFINNNLDGGLQQALAFGSVIFKPFFNDSMVMQVDVINPLNFIPLRFENNQLLDCAFIHNYTTTNNNISTYYTLFEIHKMVNNQVVVENIAFKSSNSSDLGNKVDLSSTKWNNKEPTIILNSNKPMFSYLKTICNNNINIGSDVGISFYANAYKNIKLADKAESALQYELDSAERKILMKQSTLMIKDGKANKRSRKYIGTSNDELQGDITPSLRVKEFIEAKNNKLIDIETDLQVAKGTFSEMLYEAKTATEILSTKEVTFNVVKRYQDKLRVELINLIEIMQTLKTIILNSQKIELDITFNFYDSILAQTEMSDDLMLIQASILPKYKILMNRYKYTEEEAKKYVQEAEASSTQGELI